MLRTRSAQLAVIVLMVFADCSFSQTPAPSRVTTAGRFSHPPTIQYVNKKFGFRFTLPADWRGYTIVMSGWRGRSGDANMADVEGPELLIRNPHWTEENPWEDIPIMIFTHSQWKLVKDGSLDVSAAPFGPEEIGRNQKYVFALPPRYSYDENHGYEEVIKIMEGSPLHAF